MLSSSSDDLHDWFGIKPSEALESIMEEFYNNSRKDTDIGEMIEKLTNELSEDDLNNRNNKVRNLVDRLDSIIEGTIKDESALEKDKLDLIELFKQVHLRFQTRLEDLKRQENDLVNLMNSLMEDNKRIVSKITSCEEINTFKLKCKEFEEIFKMIFQQDKEGNEPLEVI